MRILSKTVIRKLEIMFTVIALPNIYPACQMDEKNTPGSNLSCAVKRVAEPSRAESLGIKQSECDV